jgi:hypothetical protein
MFEYPLFGKSFNRRIESLPALADFVQTKVLPPDPTPPNYLIVTTDHPRLTDVLGVWRGRAHQVASLGAFSVFRIGEAP